MSREYQNGDGFGYLLSFRRQGGSGWQTARVPGADAQHFVYSNDSVRPYTPFEVKIRSYNRRGEGPESLTALVYSAEEGGPPVRGVCGAGRSPHPSSVPRQGGAWGTMGHLASFPGYPVSPQAWGRGREAPWEEKWPGGGCGNAQVTFFQGPGFSEILSKGRPLLAASLQDTGRPWGIQPPSVLVPRAQGGPYQGLGQGGLLLRDERDLGTCAAGHERHPPGVRGEHCPGSWDRKGG